MKKNWMVLLILLGLVAYSAYDYMNNRTNANGSESQTGQESGAVIGIHKGEQAPDFTLNGLDGTPVSLSDFKGKMVVLNFWASWCPPCRVEMPHMQRFYEEYVDKNVVVLGINLTSTEKSADAAQSFVEEQELSFPVLLDSKGDAMDTFRIVAYPTTYIIDDEGVIQQVFQGAMNTEMLKKQFNRLADVI